MADDEIKGIQTSQITLRHQIEKIKSLNSSDTLAIKGFNEVSVSSVDSNVDYDFDDQVFEIINEYLTNRKINHNRRMCGFIRLYATGFFEEFREYLKKPDDLMEHRPDDQPPHNIYDDINVEVDLFQQELLSHLQTVISKYPELKNRELEIQLIGTSHQLFYFSERLSKIVKDSERLRKIMQEVVNIRNKFIILRQKKATAEFFEKYPYYVSNSYYAKHQSEFSDDLFSRFPSQCAIAIQSNNYTSFIVS
jgi:hypothetical protein